MTPGSGKSGFSALFPLSLAIPQYFCFMTQSQFFGMTNQRVTFLKFRYSPTHRLTGFFSSPLPTSRPRPCSTPFTCSPTHRHLFYSPVHLLPAFCIQISYLAIDSPLYYLNIWVLLISFCFYKKLKFTHRVWPCLKKRKPRRKPKNGTRTASRRQ